MVRRSWLGRNVGRLVLVQSGDESIEGVLSETGPDGLVLTAARMPASEGDLSLAGTTYLPNAKLRFLQVLPAP